MTHRKGQRQESVALGVGMGTTDSRTIPPSLAWSGYEARDRKGRTPLHLFSRSPGQVELVHNVPLLLEGGPTFKCGTAMTVLHSRRRQRVDGMKLCSCCGRTKVRRTLLAANPDLLYRRFEISTPDIRIVTRCILTLDSIPAHRRVLLLPSCVEACRRDTIRWLIFL